MLLSIILLYWCSVNGGVNGVICLGVNSFFTCDVNDKSYHLVNFVSLSVTIVVMCVQKVQ